MNGSEIDGPDAIADLFEPDLLSAECRQADEQLTVSHCPRHFGRLALDRCTVARLSSQGAITLPTTHDVQAASGDPADDIWHVVNLDVTANGTVTVSVVQTLQPGTTGTVL